MLSEESSNNQPFTLEFDNIELLVTPYGTGLSCKSHTGEEVPMLVIQSMN